MILNETGWENIKAIFLASAVRAEGTFLVPNTFLKNVTKGVQPHQYFSVLARCNHINVLDVA